MIEETITLNAAVTKVWERFIDLSRWREWNTALTVVSLPKEGKMAEGTSFTFRIRPVVFAVNLTPLAQEVVTGRRVVLTGQWFGIRARHEFFFDGDSTATTLISRETFTGLPTRLPTWPFFENRLRKLTVQMLRDLKQAAEA